MVPQNLNLANNCILIKGIYRGVGLIRGHVAWKCASIPGRGKSFFPRTKRRDQPWNLHSVLVNGYLEMKLTAQKCVEFYSNMYTHGFRIFKNSAYFS